jgi:hypothetical protein
MSTTTTRWNLVVSKQTDRDLRQLLASEGRGKKGELSRFVEEAVSKHNANVPPEEIEAAVEESLAWARARMGRR